MKLRIGKITYANLFPIFHILQKECDCSEYEFIEGAPSDLNKKICKGEIDISPSSSIEFLRHADKYTLIENHSISSHGPVGSILLFSKRPIEALNGVTVLTSSQSDTSVALIQIILQKFYEIACFFKSTSDPAEKAFRSHEAYLLIGDEALVEALKWPRLFIYDVGELWYRNTGLPFTFALWIVRRESLNGKADLLKRFTEDLNKAKKEALKDLPAVAAASPLRHILSEEELVSYWKGISYDFGEEHKKGFDLFRKYAEELGLI
jgi:chorismate dehydratase